MSAKEMTFAAIFQDGMLLQREKPLIIWGSGLPGTTFQVTIQGQDARGIVEPDGHWSVTISGIA